MLIRVDNQFFVCINLVYWIYV